MDWSGQGTSGAAFTRGARAFRPLIATIAVTVLAGLQGCSLPGTSATRPAAPAYEAGYSCGDFDAGLDSANAALAAGKAADEAGNERCLEFYYRAAMTAWTEFDRGNAAASPVYQNSLKHLVAAANRFHRLDPRGRLTIAGAGGSRVVPIAYYGFAWKPADFSRVLPAANYTGGDFVHHYHTAGVGVSLVAARRPACEEKFFSPLQAFPVTALLRPTAAGSVLEFYNPLLFDSVKTDCGLVRIDRDLTAWLAYMKEQQPQSYIPGFFDPGEKTLKPKLVMLEPYQPGKIPVVFIHGLGSDPMTWADATNRLRAESDIYNRYQFWYFRYPTGGDLLESAAVLREQLLAARQTFDPCRTDAALEQTVLVGHSMGGLVARLQATYSYDLLWSSIARQPLEAVRVSPEIRGRLQRSFFFDPSPMVKRVVFIATPHRGSGMAQRLFGKAASKLVHYPPQQVAAYREVMDANRDIFTAYVQKGQPTTIDLLEPDNPLLQAMARMPFSRCVRLHSIIGDATITLRGDPSDGVVPVSSARLAGVCSERFVDAKHEQTNKVDDSVIELARILREHAAAVGLPQAKQ